MEKLVTLYARLRLSRSSTKSRPPCPESTAESTSSGHRAASERRAPGNPSTKCACALSSFFTANRGASGGSSWTGAIGARAAGAEVNQRSTCSRTSAGSTSPTTERVSAPAGYCSAR